MISPENYDHDLPHVWQFHQVNPRGDRQLGQERMSSMSEATGAASPQSEDTLTLRPGLATTPAVTAIAMVGVLLTGLCLVTADRLGRSSAAQILAVLAVCASLAGVMVALLGHLRATLPSPTSMGASWPRARQGVRMTMLAAVLSLVAVVLAAASALVVVLREEPRAQGAPASQLQLTGASGAMVVSVQLSIPGLTAGSVVDAKLLGLGDSYTDEGTVEGTRILLARSVVPAGTDGVAVIQLTAPVKDYRSVVVSATMPDRKCTQTLTLDDVEAEAAELTCTSA